MRRTQILKPIKTRAKVQADFEFKKVKLTAHVKGLFEVKGISKPNLLYNSLLIL